MNRAFCKLPYEPCLNRSEKELPGFGTLSGSRNVFKYPVQLGGRKISIDDETGLFADHIRKPSFDKRVAVFARPSALPYDGITYRVAGILVPHDGRFALIRDTDRGNTVGRNPRLGKSIHTYAKLCEPYLRSIMLDPTGLGIILREFFLRHGADLSGPVE